MSHEGKLRRGKRYEDLKDKEGNFPKDFVLNESRKADLDYFLKSLKPVEKPVEKPKEKKGK